MEAAVLPEAPALERVLLAESVLRLLHKRVRHAGRANRSAISRAQSAVSVLDLV